MPPWPREISATLGTTAILFSPEISEDRLASTVPGRSPFASIVDCEFLHPSRPVPLHAVTGGVLCLAAHGCQVGGACCRLFPDLLTTLWTDNEFPSNVSLRATAGLLAGSLVLICGLISAFRLSEYCLSGPLCVCAATCMGAHGTTT